ncbi:hypothetical protein DICVIV_02710 [Dictyocaulus viviparus]|uniref:Uncharacterized protein n=1 Tax=Dictyocaulus viviparus TaxID=29172 RepID=A0A0D8Y360_DICVI|nr:hypothetical protein DICVIV_02710 [Dictyocaulus viviparus]
MTSGDFELWLISLKGGEPERILEQNGCGGVTQLAVSSCGRFVALVTTRSQVFVVDVETREPQLLRVNLPIDIAFTDGDSLFVLCATDGFDESNAEEKILFEFSKHGGESRRSASVIDLFGISDCRAVSIIPGPNDQIVVISSDGQWTRSSVFGPHLSLSATRRSNTLAPKTVHFRSERRICSCRLQASEPTTAPFKLKKFGQQ